MTWLDGKVLSHPRQFMVDDSIAVLWSGCSVKGPYIVLQRLFGDEPLYKEDVDRVCVQNVRIDPMVFRREVEWLGERQVLVKWRFKG